MDARMDEIYAGLYRWAAAIWTTLQAPALLTPASLAAGWADQTLDAVAGSALMAFGARLTLPAHAAQVLQELDRAAALLRLAVQAAAAGAGVDAAQALPLYLRDKVAQTTAERTASRSGVVSASRPNIASA
jgi:tRNA threonylcarbamoyladenosine biosynthesis protein TsaB